MTRIPTHSETLRAALAGVEMTRTDGHLMAWLATCDTNTVAQLADLITRARAAGPARPTAPPAGTGRPCATCRRDLHDLDRDAHRWIVRRDGLGLMCPTCQNRTRRGRPTEREAGR